MAIYHLTIKSGNKASGKGAGGKSRYLLRQGSYSTERKKVLDGATVRIVEVDKTHELVFAESGNMPSWAVADPVRFWDASDEHERANGVVYREVEIALPSELNLEQQTALAKEFASSIANTKDGPTPYTLVIHQQDDDHPNHRHAHILLNDRVIDGIDRGAEQFFKRYNGKEPSKGGSRKAEERQATPGRNWAHDLRPHWERLANKHLEMAGVTVRIDHRSLEDQQAELEQRAEQAKGIDEKVDLMIAASKLDRKPIHKGKTTYHNPAKAPDRMAELHDYEQYRAALHRQRRGERVLSKRIPDPEQILQHTQDRLTATEKRPGIRYPERDRWVEWRRKKLTEAYGKDMAEKLAPWVRVQRDKENHLVLTNREIEVVDQGDRVVAGKGGTDREIQVILEVAKAKGWSTLSLTGPAEFQDKMARAALSQGFALADKDLEARTRTAMENEAAERARKEAEQERIEAEQAAAKAEAERIAAEIAELDRWATAATAELFALGKKPVKAKTAPQRAPQAKDQPTLPSQQDQPVFSPPSPTKAEPDRRPTETQQQSDKRPKMPSRQVEKVQPPIPSQQRETAPRPAPVQRPEIPLQQTRPEPLRRPTEQPSPAPTQQLRTAQDQRPEPRPAQRTREQVEADLAALGYRLGYAGLTLAPENMTDEQKDTFGRLVREGRPLGIEKARTYVYQGWLKGQQKSRDDWLNRLPRYDDSHARGLVVGTYLGKAAEGHLCVVRNWKRGGVEECCIVPSGMSRKLDNAPYIPVGAYVSTSGPEKLPHLTKLEESKLSKIIEGLPPAVRSSIQAQADKDREQRLAIGRGVRGLQR